MRHPRNNGSGDGCFLYRENRRAHVTRIGSVGGRNQECVRPSKAHVGCDMVVFVSVWFGGVPDEYHRIGRHLFHPIGALVSGLGVVDCQRRLFGPVFPSNCRGGGMFLAVEVFSGDVRCRYGRRGTDRWRRNRLPCRSIPPNNLRFVRNPALLSIARRYR